jgi:hypothetical protein
MVWGRGSVSVKVGRMTHAATQGAAGTAVPHTSLPHPRSFNPQGDWDVLLPLMSGSLLAALGSLTHLRASCCLDADVSALTRLRRLEVFAQGLCDQDPAAVEGLSGLTALEDLRLDCDGEPLAQPSDLAPLSALTRLAMTCVPPELASHPVAARLRRLELQAFGVLEYAPAGGDGSGANGAAAAALAALARGAPLLERLRIRVLVRFEFAGRPTLLGDHPGDVELGAPLGPGVAWPSLTHLQVTAWAALLLASCAFPRLSRLAADICEKGGDQGIVSNERLRTAVAALAAKARDHVALRVNNRLSSNQVPDQPGADVLAAAAAVPGLRHLSWLTYTSPTSWRGGTAPATPGDWARLAASLESLELVGYVPAFGYAEPLAALTGLTRLFLQVDSIYPPDDTAAAAQPPLPPAGGGREPGEPYTARAQLARAARALAVLPRLAHLRLTFPKGDGGYGCTSDWACPAVAAELARCPALRLLEIDRPDDPLWRHERGPDPCAPLPSPAWPPFAKALRARGCDAAVRPVRASTGMHSEAFDIEF